MDCKEFMEWSMGWEWIY